MSDMARFTDVGKWMGLAICRTSLLSCNVALEFVVFNIESSSPGLRD
jgi:hypothetical protein